ncbi:hypothetical protein FMUND_7418 [Fusarium mundagurra]|uniref:Uncharacterized protein n=1 Tax=Fusarium mundagurra TaxID=1567541 RepID=A0A8H5YNG4_9HYPO|nr:hypothetical protein FMUND_7418 [Fusarium mundagurra]
MVPLRHRNNGSHREDQIRGRCRSHSPSRTSRSQTGGSQNRGQDRGAGRRSQRRSRSPRRSPVASNRNRNFGRTSRPTGITRSQQGPSVGLGSAMDLGREAGGRNFVEPMNDAKSFMENEEVLVRVTSSSGQTRQGTAAALSQPSRANFVETQNSGLVQELRAQISQTVKEKDEAIKEKEMAINSERQKDGLIKELSDKNNELSDIVKFQECHILDLLQELGEKDKALEAERVKSQSLEAALSEFRR